MKGAKKNLKQQGNQFYKRGQYGLASAMYKKYVKKQHPDNKNAYVNWAICEYKLQKYQQCIEASKKAIQLDSNFSKAFYWLSQASEQNNKKVDQMIYAKKFCELFQGDKISKQYRQVETELKKIQSKVLFAQPEQCSSKNSNIFPKDYLPKQQKVTLFKLNQECPNVQQILNKAQINKKDEINSLYGKINDKTLTLNKKKQMRKVIKIISGKQTVNQFHQNNETTQKVEQIQKNYEITNEPQLKEDEKGSNESKQKQNKQIMKKQEIKNVQKNQISTQIHSQTQKTKQKSSQTVKEINNFDEGDLFNKYFLEKINSKKDMFEGFYQVITEIPQTVSSIADLINLLQLIPKKYDMFQPLQLSLSSKQKLSIKTMLEQIGMHAFIKTYCS